MEVYKLETLNLKGKNKIVNVIFLQVTHTDVDNAVDLGLKGVLNILSHGTNRSAGVAVLFTAELATGLISNKFIKAGCLLVRATIQGLVFVFMTVYAHNAGMDRVILFEAMKQELSPVEQDNIIVQGGDFNCTIDPHLNRRWRAA